MSIESIDSVINCDVRRKAKEEWTSCDKKHNKKTEYLGDENWIWRKKKKKKKKKKKEKNEKKKREKEDKEEA